MNKYTEKEKKRALIISKIYKISYKDALKYIYFPNDIKYAIKYGDVKHIEVTTNEK